MKTKDAHKELGGLSGEELYKKACEMYALEIDQLIYIRSHGRKPTVGVVESAVKQVADWFRKVSEGLAWEGEETPRRIIEYETGEAYVRNNFVDPRLVDWGKRTRREMMKGTPLPMLEAMKSGDLEAASAMMMANIRQDVKNWSEVEDRRKAFAERYGFKRCFPGTERRHCEYQKTYVMELPEGKPLPTSTSDVVFICTLDECIEGKGGQVIESV